MYDVPKVSIRSTGLEVIAKSSHVQSNTWLMYESSDVQFWVWCWRSKNVAVIFSSTTDLSYRQVSYECMLNYKNKIQTIVVEAFDVVRQSGHLDSGEQIYLLWSRQEEDLVRRRHLCSDDRRLPTHWVHARGLGQWGVGPYWGIREHGWRSRHRVVTLLEALRRRGDVFLFDCWTGCLHRPFRSSF